MQELSLGQGERTQHHPDTVGCGLGAHRVHLCHVLPKAQGLSWARKFLAILGPGPSVQVSEHLSTTGHHIPPGPGLSCQREHSKPQSGFYLFLFHRHQISGKKKNTEVSGLTRATTATPPTTDTRHLKTQADADPPAQAVEAVACVRLRRALCCACRCCVAWSCCRCCQARSASASFATSIASSSCGSQ